MAQKTDWQSFQTEWSKTVAWAHQQNIPASAYMPIYQEDASRLAQGNYQMSQGERTAQIATAAGRGVTQLPIDNPSPLNVIHNVKADAMRLFSGFDPVSMVKNLFDTVTSAVEHPAQELLLPAGDIMQMNISFLTGQWNSKANQQARSGFEKALTQDPHSLWTFVPGAFDLAEALKGKQGFRYLADNPITSIIDVLPMAKVPMTLLAKTAMGARIAEAAGVSTEELGKLGPFAASHKLVSKIPTKDFMVDKAALASGDLESVMRRVTVGDSMRAWAAERLHWDTQAAEVGKTIRVREEIGSKAYRETYMPLKKIGRRLTDESKQRVFNYISQKVHVPGGDLRPLEEIFRDTTQFNHNELDYMEALYDAGRAMDEINLQGDHPVLKRTPTVLPDAQGVLHENHELYLNGGIRHLRVQGSLDEYRGLNDEFHRASSQFKMLRFQALHTDAVMGHLLPQLDNLCRSVYDSVRATLPDIAQDDPRYEQLRKAVDPKAMYKRVSPNDDSKILQDMLGLDQKTELRITRGRGDDINPATGRRTGTQQQVAPFSGVQKKWSPAERDAHDNATTATLRTMSRDDKGFTKARNDLRMDYLRMTGDVREVKVNAPVPANVARIVSEVLSPGGLKDQVKEAFEKGDYAQVSKLAKAINDKLSTKAFMSPTRSEVFGKMVDGLKLIDQFAKTRRTLSEKMSKIMTGKTLSGRKIGKEAVHNALEKYAARVENAKQKYLKACIDNPPTVWRVWINEQVQKETMEREAGHELTAKVLHEGKKSPTELAHEQGGTQLLKLGDTQAIESLANDEFQNTLHDEAEAVQRDLHAEVADMRAKGYELIHLRTLHPWDDEKEGVTISGTGVSTRQIERDVRGESSTINNYEVAITHDGREYIKQSQELQFQERDLPGYLHQAETIRQLIDHQWAVDMIDWIKSGRGNKEAFYETKYMELGLKKFRPSSIFSVTHPMFKVDADGHAIGWLIPQGIETELVKGFNPNRFGIYDKYTNLFRTSILRVSPRFFMHVVVGGAVLAAAHVDPNGLRSIGEAYRIARSKSFSPEFIDKYKITDPEFEYVKLLGPDRSVQEGGWGQTVLSSAGGYSAGQLAIREKMARVAANITPDHPDFLPHYLKAAWDANYTTTRFFNRIYKATMLLQGIKDAERHGHFFMDAWDEEKGAITRQQFDMTPDRALHEGMIQVNKALGDALLQTPLERNFLLRAFPFWSWSKHIIEYTAHFPADHPYRAMLFTQLSRIGLADQNNPGLPARTQLLFFLGSPDPRGNVHAIDMRFANPLRDTGTLMGLSGWIAALNPAITTPFAMIDPQITFGGNVLYPNLTYDAIYGTATAASPNNGAFTAAEAVVPEISALDAAFNLSGNYGYLQKTNKNALITKIMQSLNIPFLYEQDINLKQIAGKNEADRWQQAKAAASQAWKTGDFSSLQGYGMVPDPRQNQYNISPAALQAEYQRVAASLVGTGLQPFEVVANLPAPTYA